MKRLLSGLLGLMVMVTISATAQDRTITGKVTAAEDGTGLPGVNIIVQGTTKGTTTDLDGYYSITIAQSEITLIFSFVGFKTQTIDVGNKTTIDVILESDVSVLEDVVVVGYGEQKKSDVTGSVATVKGDVLSQQPVLTATQALQGKVAGVQIISSGQPGSSPQVRVRGLGTAIAGTTALYVVDGVLTDDISNINTADIVSTTILKDASAAAIYGSRGANGVIIITTRKGAASEAITINYNNSIGIRQAANLVEMANAEEYRNYFQAATGTIPAASDFDTDWYDVILRTAQQQNHNISLSGGTEKATYYLNAGYLKEQGIIVGNDFQRFTLRFNNDYKISDKINFGLQSSYGNSINENGFSNIDIDAFGNVGSVYNDAYRASPIIASKVGRRYGNTSVFQNVGNPLLDIENNSIKVKDNRLQGSTYLEVKPLEWLSLRSSFGADWRNSLNRGYYYKFLATDEYFLIGNGNQYRAVSNLNIKQTQTFRWVWDNTATVTRKFGKHSLTALVGVTAEKLNQHWLSAKRDDVPPDESLWYINVGDANTSQNDGKGDAWARNSYLARVNVRRDGSSRFKGSNRWAYYPSVGMGWVISSEPFLQNQHIFDFLKLRGSYGKVGNDQIPTDASTSLVTPNKAYPFNGSVSDATNGAQINQVVDPNIHWETTEEFDLALEFEILDSRLSGEVNYYNKKVKDALIWVPVLSTIGDSDGVILTNAASFENRGWEVVLNWRHQINDDWSYNVSGNVTFNTNKVLALNGGQAIPGGSIGAAQGFTTLTDNGHPIGSFHVLKVLGVFNSTAEVNAYTNSEGGKIQPDAKPGEFKYWDKNLDGRISDDDRVFAGSYQPVAYYGINAGVTFRQWDLSLSLYGNAGNEVYNGKKAVRVDGRDNVEKDIVYNRWTSSNKTQSEPAANVGNLPASTYFVESGSFIRINNLTLGYTFRPTSLQPFHISSLRVFATSQNLLTYQKYSGFTAELPGDPINSGIELSSYPTTRTISAGINIGF
jgi:TonB-dependent starch-binding outer membrane protein SusC